MTDFRSDAEKFVTEFLDYVQEHDLLDFYNKRTQKMERSPGVESLIAQARSVFPERASNGKIETDKLSSEEISEAISSSPNVVDTRAEFSRRVALNGGTRRLLRDLFDGASDARDRVADFLAAEDGDKEFKE